MNAVILTIFRKDGTAWGPEPPSSRLHGSRETPTSQLSAIFNSPMEPRRTQRPRK